jgi:hypothetical protein
MIMTDLAVRDLQVRRDTVMERVRGLFVSVFGRSSDHQLPVDAVTRRPEPFRVLPQPADRTEALRLVEPRAAAAGEKRWERHPQLRARQAERAPMPGSERAARLEAERGVILARGGKLVEAVEAFTTAASDASIDLGALPGFWDLPRNGMLAAVRAYERTDRLRDAAALEARIRHLLRPRALKPIPSAPRPGRITASGD